MKLNLVGGSNGYINNMFSPERTINMFMSEVPGANEFGLVMIPGSKKRYTHPTGENTRALYVGENEELATNLYAVYGSDVIAHNNDLDALLIGELENTTTGYVGITANNTKQIVFVDGVNGYVYDYNGAPTFEQIVSAGFPAAPIDVAFLDGHVLVANGGTNQWYASDINDAASYDALNFASITSEQDLIVGIRVVNRRIFVFGTQITEIFYNSASNGILGSGSTFPFIRDNNVVLQYGCASVASISQRENKMVWVATEKDGPPSVRVTTGGQAVKISSPAVDYALQNYSDISQIKGHLYYINGHTFYLMNNPVDNQTWVYDFSSRQWHEQQMIDGSCYFGVNHAYFNKKHYFGHYNEPSIFEINSNFVTNNDENIHCVRIPPPINHPDLQRIRIDRLEIQGNQGSGAKEKNQTGIFYDDFELAPKVYMSFSRDNGVTYTDPVFKTIGEVGRYDWETVWGPLGVAKRFVFKFETFNACKVMFLRGTCLIAPVGY